MDKDFKEYHRGEIYYANLNPVYGSEQGGIRPVLILQNNIGNHYSPTLVVAPDDQTDREKAVFIYTCYLKQDSGYEV